MDNLDESGYKNVFLNYKIWLSTVSGEGIIGENEYYLLKYIIENGSLKAAADQKGISYRKAWGDIKKAEELLGYQLLERQRGGKSGGNSSITKKGQKLIEAYEAFQQKLDDSVEKAYAEFKDQLSK